MDWIFPVLALAMVAGGVAIWWFTFGESMQGNRNEREIKKAVTTRNYARAIPALVEQERFEEAAELWLQRDRPEAAAKLYEQAGNLQLAAECYLKAEKPDIAGQKYVAAGMLNEAATMYKDAGLFAEAAKVFEKLEFWGKAIDAWRETDNQRRLAELLIKKGNAEEGHAMVAEMAEAAAQWEEAAKHWGKAGEKKKQTDVLVKAGKIQEAAKLMLAADDSEGAALLLGGHGRFEEAGKVFVKMGELRDAAHSFYRAGKTEEAEKILAQLEDWFTLARLLHQQGKSEKACNALRRVSPEDPDFEQARIYLAELARGLNRPKLAVNVLDTLVKWRIKDGRVDPDVRTWILQGAEILIAMGKVDDALAHMKRLERLGLMTPELSEKIKALEEGANSQADVDTLAATLGLPTHARYEFIAKLGEGANGLVYKARDKNLNRELAIKMIGDTALPGEMAREFFLREAKTAAMLNHPNIVTIYDLGEIDGQSYIGMELIDGQELTDFLEEKDGIMTPAEALPIVKQLAEALAFAHEHKVIHRDVKLENVMLTATGEVKLMDFGFAQAITGEERNVVIAGTPLYMAPEQIMGVDSNHRSDIYAFGVLVYRLLVGDWPFPAENILMHHRQTPIPDPRAVREELPPAFTDIIQKALAKSPDERYADARELVNDMTAMLN